METSAILAVSAVGLLLLAVVLIVAASRAREVQRAIGVLSRETRAQDKGAVPLGSHPGRSRRDTNLSAPAPALAQLATASTEAPTTWIPPDPGALGATRRQFLNRSITGAFTVGLTGFGAAAVAFLWPKLGSGFGSTIRFGDLDELVAEIRDNSGFLYKPEGRMWLTEYPSSALEKARAVYSPPELSGMEAGVVALYQKCPHLGCRVPGCETSQWFECPCHGSQYNQVGEKKGGPAPRGMDRFAMSVSGGSLSVDTGTIIPGPAIGTNTTGQEAEGPHCIGSTEEH